VLLDLTGEIEMRTFEKIWIGLATLGFVPLICAITKTPITSDLHVENSWERHVSVIAESLFGPERVTELLSSGDLYRIEQEIADAKIHELDKEELHKNWGKYFVHHPFHLLPPESHFFVESTISLIARKMKLRNSLKSEFELAVVGSQNAGKSRFINWGLKVKTVKYGQDQNTRFPLMFKLPLKQTVWATDYPGFQDNNNNFALHMLEFGIPAASACIVILEFKNANMNSNVVLLNALDRLSTCRYLVCLNQVDTFFFEEIEDVKEREQTECGEEDEEEEEENNEKPANAVERDKIQLQAAKLTQSRYHVLLQELGHSTRNKATFCATTGKIDNLKKMRRIFNKHGVDMELEGYKYMKNWMNNQVDEFYKSYDRLDFHSN